jgi:hypothetical protein
MRRALALVVAALAVMATSPAMSAAADGAVTVWKASGEHPAPCPAIDASDPSHPRGGCFVEMHTRDIAIVIRSVVGDMQFGTCSYEHDMRVDGQGRTYLDGISAGGPNPCNDMNACYHEDAKPWRGRIEAGPDGRLTHVIDACLDTCMGQFVGQLRLSLKRIGGRWEQTADHALVGDSGYQIDGSWYMERDVDIRPADSAGGEAAGAWRLTGEPVGWPI